MASKAGKGLREQVSRSAGHARLERAPMGASPPSGKPGGSGMCRVEVTEEGRCSRRRIVPWQCKPAALPSPVAAAHLQAFLLAAGPEHP